MTTIYNRADGLEISTYEELLEWENKHKLCLEKIVRSEWRQRTIKLYRIDEKIVSIGIPWNESSVIICLDDPNDWARELSNPNRTVTTY